MSLPVYKTENKDLTLLQSTWKSQIDPVLNSILGQGILLKSVSLASGSNVINHKLGRKLQGWMLTRVRAGATISDTQDANTTPALTLLLTSSIAAVVDIYVF